MKQDWKYSIALIITFIGIIAFQLFGPKPLDWKHSYSKEDKIPYGNYILYSRLQDIFPHTNITPVLHTIYETVENYSTPTNYIFINESFKISKVDANKLLEFVSKGNYVFIASNEISKNITDTLNVKQVDKLHVYSKDSSESNFLPDSVGLKINNTTSDNPLYYFKREAVISYLDTTGSNKASVLGKNQFNDPTLITVLFGKGKFILSSTPLVYTNYNMLHGHNAQFIAQTLSFLPVENVLWDEYYLKPRKNTDTPLRFILEQEGLKWAFYLILISIILFMLFEAKRRQRIIPIIKAPANESLEFIKTIGGLYMHSNNSTVAAKNKITYFSEFIRRKYLLRTTTLDNTFIELLSQKSGVEKEIVSELVSLINFIQQSTSIKEEHLIKLNHLIQEFQKNS